MHYRRGVAVLGILLLAGLAASVVPASASARRPGRDASVTAPFLVSQIAASSARNAWAVGAPLDPRRGAAFTLRWNGKTWKQVPIPKPGQDEQLRGVAVRTVADAWAVGQSGVAYHFRPVILHWNGAKWKTVPVSTPADSELAGVRALSPNYAWAVGFSRNGMLALRWDGKSWKQTAVPAGIGFLFDVVAVSRSRAWAVGDDRASPTKNDAVLLAWNGTAWHEEHLPKVAGSGFLDGVAAVSARDAWAVGANGTAGAIPKFHTLILRWNGTSWTRVASPNPSSSCEVADVAATSATNAWAVGDCIVDGDVDVAMVLHWNGHAWKKAPTPLEDQPLSSVTAPAAGEVWVAGEQGIWRWTGRAWQ